YSSPGTCMGGACTTYPSQTFPCDSPPPATCIGTTRRTFSPTGSCSGGVCSYTPTDTACSFGCTGGTCNADPCANVTCNSPPAAVCVNSTTRRTFAASGTCSGGTCSYAPTDTTCVNGCSGGNCVACAAGNACTGNPGAPCRTGVTACPGGANSAAVCSDGANTTSDCGGIINTTCSYASFCAESGNLVGQQQTCSGGTCSGTRPISVSGHPMCNRAREGVVCQTSGGCTGSETFCVCRLQQTSTCQTGTCTLDTTQTVSCGFCMEVCPEI
ncbi:MAG: hypothetical protein MUC96_36315, partial [Myxococcaceae bacterium]|nr:hypothetical protein [Myxococcaceae bacterium]